MRTFKIFGSGPCAGQVFYATVAGPDPERPSGVLVDTDEFYQIGDRSGNRLTLNIETGMHCFTNGVDSNIFQVDPKDLCNMQNAYKQAEWSFPR